MHAKRKTFKVIRKPLLDNKETRELSEAEKLSLKFSKNKLTKEELLEHLEIFKAEKAVNFKPENYNKRENNKATKSFIFLRETLKGEIFNAEELSDTILEEIYDYVKIDFMTEKTKNAQIDVLSLLAFDFSYYIPISYYIPMAMQILSVFSEFYRSSETVVIDFNRKVIKHMAEKIAIKLIAEQGRFLSHYLSEFDLSFRDLETFAYYCTPGVLQDIGFPILQSRCYEHPNFTMKRMLEDFVNS